MPVYVRLSETSPYSLRFLEFPAAHRCRAAATLARRQLIERVSKWEHRVDDVVFSVGTNRCQELEVYNHSNQVVLFKENDNGTEGQEVPWVMCRHGYVI